MPTIPTIIPATFVTVEVYRVHTGPGATFQEYPRNPAGLAAANLLAAAKGGCAVTPETREVMTSDEQVIE
jgi:hypothetical protein